jgi:hypothetical protein
MNNSTNNKFGGYVSIDKAPPDSVCESRNCGKAAAHTYMVTAGIFHKREGHFCASCGATYTFHIERLSKKAKKMAESLPESLYDWTYRRIHEGTLDEQGAWKAEEIEAEEILEKHIKKIEGWKEYIEWLEGRYPQ